MARAEDRGYLIVGTIPNAFVCAQIRTTLEYISNVIFIRPVFSKTKLAVLIQMLLADEKKKGKNCTKEGRVRTPFGKRCRRIVSTAIKQYFRPRPTA